MFTDKLIAKYFKLAKKASEFSDYPNIHIGAICVYKHQVIAIGCNTLKSSPMQMRYNHYREKDNRDFDAYANTNSLHAEISCISSIRSLDIDYSKVGIFIYREHKNGTTGLVKPCKACSKCLDDIGIKNWYYTTDDGYIYERRN